MPRKPRQPVDVRARILDRMQQLGLSRYAVVQRMKPHISSETQIYQYLSGRRDIAHPLFQQLLAELDLDLKPVSPKRRPKSPAAPSSPHPQP